MYSFQLFEIKNIKEHGIKDIKVQVMVRNVVDSM